MSLKPRVNYRVVFSYPFTYHYTINGNMIKDAGRPIANLLDFTFESSATHVAQQVAARFGAAVVKEWDEKQRKFLDILVFTSMDPAGVDATSYMGQQSRI